jgi:hypothetical protein
VAKFSQKKLKRKTELSNFAKFLLETQFFLFDFFRSILSRRHVYIYGIGKINSFSFSEGPFFLIFGYKNKFGKNTAYVVRKLFLKHFS